MSVLKNPGYPWLMTPSTSRMLCVWLLQWLIVLENINTIYNTFTTYHNPKYHKDEQLLSCKTKVTFNLLNLKLKQVLTNLCKTSVCTRHQDLSQSYWCFLHVMYKCSYSKRYTLQWKLNSTVGSFMLLYLYNTMLGVKIHMCLTPQGGWKRKKGKLDLWDLLSYNLLSVVEMINLQCLWAIK